MDVLTDQRLWALLIESSEFPFKTLDELLDHHGEIKTNGPVLQVVDDLLMLLELNPEIKSDIFTLFKLVTKLLKEY